MSDKNINQNIISSSLEETINDIGHYLPSQGPISTFVHHNTLHLFEKEYFFDAVEHASRIYSAYAYLPEEKYQEEYDNGRISQSDINKILGEIGFDGTPWILSLSKRKFCRSILLAGQKAVSLEALRWRLIEKENLFKYQPQISVAKRKRLINEDKSNITYEVLDVIKKLCDIPSPEWSLIWSDNFTKKFKEPDLIKIKSNWNESDSTQLLWIYCANLVKDLDLDELKDIYLNTINFNSSYSKEHQITEIVNPYLIKFIAGYLDIGLSKLKVKNHNANLLSAFLSHIELGKQTQPEWINISVDEYKNLSSIEIIEKHLKENNINEVNIKDYLLKKALVLKGWAGLIYRTEVGATGINIDAKLADYLAIRFILEKSATHYYQNNISYFNSSFKINHADNQNNYFFSYCYYLFTTLQFFGISATKLINISKEHTDELINISLSFKKLKRLRIWQKAYEWNLYSKAMSAIVANNSNTKPIKRSPKCQIVCCIDDREESFRRYVEECSDEYQTFGTAGFFGVDAEFQSLYERPAAFCPVNITPKHQIKVVPKAGTEQKVNGLSKLIQFKSDITQFLLTQSQSFTKGWLLAFGGILALFPLLLTILTPRVAHKFKKKLSSIWINPQEETSLIFSQDDPLGDKEKSFNLEEMAFRVKTLLVTSGLIKELAPLVIVVGHGSFSMNNPYRSAYDCGACGGRPGRLNPRAFTLMANRQDVREYLKSQNFIIPDSTFFLPAYHNTCTDEVEYFDVTTIPSTHKKIFERVKSDIEIARAKNALERCRRFDESIIRDTKKAIQHVESRAHHIAQPRPEYGHATNALCVVGRREITKHLFLDRRSFLVSYDKTIDPDSSALRNLLKAVIPVCMGINLEYYFSAIDNQVYGAGTKLPHNVTSLVGLMTGYCSDLRTGLPQQMIEIHEPTRLLVIIELEPEKLVKAFEQEPELYTVIKNKWVIIASYDSQENQFYFFNENNSFEPVKEISVSPPEINSSIDWVIGKKDNLDFVEIKL